VVALWMAYESVVRLYEHPEVRFGEALPVAVIGLLVNLASVALLAGAHAHAHAGHGHGKGHGHGHGHGHEHEHDHDHDHEHDHEHGEHDAHAHAEVGGNVHEGPKRHHDQNLRAAYLHVMADALTSVLAIVALVAGYYTNAWYLDPLMGAVGGIIIAKWSIGLCRDTAAQLLDVVPSEEIAKKIERRLEADGLAVADLHVWELAPGQRGCIVAVVAAEPRAVAEYRRMILEEVPLAHLTVEVHRCGRGHGAPAA
jgi:cation diffusion facilitator family transporter